VNAIRIAALSVLLAASGALAQGKKQVPKLPEPVITEKDIPKNCDEQCDLVEKVAASSCLQEAKTKQAQQKCGEPFAKMVAVCKDSCREKGRIDKQFMMERMKPPPGVKPPKEGSKSKGEDHEEH
jgi:hypothetical protein